MVPHGISGFELHRPGVCVVDDRRPLGDHGCVANLYEYDFLVAEHHDDSRHNDHCRL